MKAFVFLVMALGLLACSRQAPDARAGLTPAVLAATKKPLLLIEAPAINASALLNPHYRRGGLIDWRTGDNVSLSFTRGVITATRGLGDDLMSADASATIAMLRNGTNPGSYTRFTSRLDGEYQTELRSFLCRRTGRSPEAIDSYGRIRQTIKVTELCRNPDRSFENTYWIGSDGTMWKSRQWISPNVEYIITERLVR